MLDPFSRAAIVTMSVACVAGAVALAPAHAHGSAVGNEPISLAAVDRLSRGEIADTQVRRDPFSGEPSDDGTVSVPPQAPSAAAPLSGTTESNAIPALPGNLTQTGMPALPGNLGANAIPAVPGDAAGAASDLRVTAIVTGSHSYAMLDVAGTTAIKGVGDRIEGVAITAIDINGITLAGGRRLIVAPNEGHR